VTDREVSEAAESVVFSRLDRTAVTDLDISVSFDGTLDVDVYIEASGDTEQVAEDAALAARAAADELLDGEEVIALLPLGSPGSPDRDGGH